jgi:sensor histidine kinase YesM
LRQTKLYLSLEERRFGDAIKWDFDIPLSKEDTERFLLPVLTLQPIVENAVRHGILKKKEGGTVTIRARKDAGIYRVEIADDGVGFDMHEADPEKKADSSDTRGHVGLENVRNRLELRLGGSLEVESEPGVGTLVRITVPA